MQALFTMSLFKCLLKYLLWIIKNWML